MLWPDAVTINGVALPLADVLADVVIHHGRVNVDDGPSATTCQVTVRDVTRSFVKAFEIGSELIVTVRDGTAPPVRRFTGAVTDARLEVDVLTIIATARLSTLNRYTVGKVPWPVESWSNRVRRIFGEAGLFASLVMTDPLFDPPLAGRDPATAGETKLGDYLTFLAPMIGAAVVDELDGRILVQPIDTRTLSGALVIPPADVLYAPAWTLEPPGGNVVTVRYTGDQSEQVTVTDAASVDLYGEVPQTIDTTFTDTADASTRASSRLSRAAFSHWTMPEAPALRPMILRVGQAVELGSLPPASPFNPWTPIVEGWTDELSGDSWRMGVSLSDPLGSGLALPWNAVPPAVRWVDVDPSVEWRDAVTLDSILNP